MVKKQTAQTSQEIAFQPNGLYQEVHIYPDEETISFYMKNAHEYVKITDTVTHKTFEIHKRNAWRMLFYYYGIRYSKIKQLTCEEKTKLIRKLLKDSYKHFKAQMNERGEIIFIRSSRFEQVSWVDIKESVNNAITKTYGEMPEHFDRLRNAWDYKIPTQHQLMDFWYEIYAGTNLGSSSQAKSITVNIRARTIAPLKSMSSSCLNWSTFKSPSRWFGFKENHISQIIPYLKSLVTREIHIPRGKERLDENKLAEIFKNQEKALNEAMTTIDKYLHTALTKQDMKALIEVYKRHYGLPKYVIEDIPKLIKEPTIWGLSNAFSFFRTHCDYKKSKRSREESSLTQRLDFIAGELIVVAPFIAHLKQKFKNITTSLLISPPQQ